MMNIEERFPTNDEIFIDRKAEVYLTLAKYFAYLAAFTGIFLYNKFADSTPALILISLIIASGSIRHFILYANPSHNTYIPISFIVELILITLLSIVDRSGISNFLYYVLISELTLSLPLRQTYGYAILFLGVFLAGQIAEMPSKPFFILMIDFFLNSIGIVFSYIVCYLVRLQQRDKEVAELAVRELERSKAELEKAQEMLIAHAKEREKSILLEERTRMAGEIHDTLAHTLTTIIIQLEAIEKTISKEPEKAIEITAKARNRAREGLNDVRRTVSALRPERIAAESFNSSLRSLIHGYEENGITIKIEGLEDAKIPENAHHFLYRFIQEAITNGIRHGNARHFRLLLENEPLRVSIENDGSLPEQINEGFGLKGMKERARELNAGIGIKTAPSFIIEVTFGDVHRPTTDGR